MAEKSKLLNTRPDAAAKAAGESLQDLGATITGWIRENAADLAGYFRKGGKVLDTVTKDNVKDAVRDLLDHLNVTFLSPTAVGHLTAFVSAGLWGEDDTVAKALAESGDINDQAKALNKAIGREGNRGKSSSKSGGGSGTDWATKIGAVKSLDTLNQIIKLAKERRDTLMEEA